MLLEPLQINGIPQGKCFAKKCKDCVHYRLWAVKDKVTQEKSHKRECCLDMLYRTLPDMIGAIDGAQQASNETRNEVSSFAAAAVKSFKVIAESAPKLLRSR